MCAPAKRHKAPLAGLTSLLSLLWAPGCTGGGATGTTGGFFRDPFRKNGEEWTILCAEIEGPGRAEQSEQIAGALRRTRDIIGNRVRVVHGDGVSRIYYGSYFRFADHRTGKLTIPTVLHDDLLTIKQLGNQGRPFFLSARMAPAPTPDVGNPKWNVKNNPDDYSLRVALFYNESGFTDRKQAAALYCQELRSKGFEAYYRHGERTSEVFVGSFGEEAMIEHRERGLVMRLPSAEVQELQKKESFRYELWNMKPRSSDYGQGRVIRPSQLIRVRGGDELGAP